jgi:hypothetical protein
MLGGMAQSLQRHRAALERVHVDAAAVKSNVAVEI